MAGRPKAKIDWRRVDQMLMAQCTAVEIAAALGLGCEDTLYNACKRDNKIDFSAYSQQKRAKGHATAKEVFYQKAFIEKDTTAAIFWSKQHLGWTDKKEVKAQVDSAVTVVELPSNGTSPQSEKIEPDWDNQPSVNKTIIRPNPGRQTEFLANQADICIYGGAAGGG